MMRHKHTLQIYDEIQSIYNMNALENLIKVHQDHNGRIDQDKEEMSVSSIFMKKIITSNITNEMTITVHNNYIAYLYLHIIMYIYLQINISISINH